AGRDLGQDGAELRTAVIDHRPAHRAHDALGQRCRSGDSQLAREGHGRAPKYPFSRNAGAQIEREERVRTAPGAQGRLRALVRVDVSRDVITGRFFGGCIARRASRAYAGTGTCTRTGSRATWLEKLHVVGDDLGHAPLLAVLTLPGACLDAALNENERAFARV